MVFLKKNHKTTSKAERKREVCKRNFFPSNSTVLHFSALLNSTFTFHLNNGKLRGLT